MPTPKRDELRDRLFEALRPEDKNKTVEQSAKEMKFIREDCRKLRIDYPKLLVEVCQTLSAERRKLAP